MVRIVSPEIAERDRRIRMDVIMLMSRKTPKSKAYEIVGKALGLTPSYIAFICVTKSGTPTAQKRHALRIVDRDVQFRSARYHRSIKC